MVDDIIILSANKMYMATAYHCYHNCAPEYEIKETGLSEKEALDKAVSILIQYSVKDIFCPCIRLHSGWSLICSIDGNEINFKSSLEFYKQFNDYQYHPLVIAEKTSIAKREIAEAKAREADRKAERLAIYESVKRELQNKNAGE